MWKDANSLESYRQCRCCHSVDTMTSQLSLRKVAPDSLRLQLKKCKCVFLRGRDPICVFLQCSEAQKHALERTLQMERFTIPTFFVYVGLGHLQPAGAEWEKRSCLRYHTYFILPHVSLKNSIFLHVLHLFAFSPVQPI